VITFVDGELEISRPVKWLRPDATLWAELAFHQRSPVVALVAKLGTRKPWNVMLSNPLWNRAVLKRNGVGFPAVTWVTSEPQVAILICATGVLGNPVVHRDRLVRERDAA
jgi:hypothetical protein